jgi:mannan endo-1,6-alpha-mannosidase
MAAMTAAETGLSISGAQEGEDWLDLVKNVFDTQVHPDRWNESESCGGGLHWQISPSNAGYSYKNSASQAVLFNVASRLARYTGNQTYADWAEKVWTWMESVGLMYEDEQGGIAIYDGAQVDSNCTSINKIRLSYTAGVFLQGAAFMYIQVRPIVAATAPLGMY